LLLAGGFVLEALLEAALLAGEPGLFGRWCFFAGRQWDFGRGERFFVGTGGVSVGLLR
jgi:hypothetical protein